VTVVEPCIPIQNLYYLFCYAWDRFPEGRAIAVGSTDSPEILDLFAHVLVSGVRRLLRRGFDRGYIETSEETESPRGRIAIGDTIVRNLLQHGRVACLVDDLRHDVLHNQIIKATIRSLARSALVAPELIEELATLHRTLYDVSDIRLTSQLFRRVQLTRTTAHYDLLLRISELIHSRLLPDQEGETTRFADILADEVVMSDVFERFVRNFYHREMPSFRVGSERIAWGAEAMRVDDLNYLPSMVTDVSLRSQSRTVVIDAKFWVNALSQYRGNEKIRSAHMYQMFAYLKNLERRGGPDANAEGILLYPVVASSFHLDYVIDGHRLRVMTINLDTSWKGIRDQLLRMVVVDDCALGNGSDLGVLTAA
jgi:5-methylcytosine-specific restriction enzyme subunit McrC